MVARIEGRKTATSTGNLLYGRVGEALARVIPIAPSSEPVWPSNVRGLTLGSDWSHCVAVKWVLFKPKSAQGRGTPAVILGD
jgi:hypothetical protein